MKNKNKNTSLDLTTIILIVIVVISAIGLYAWAKYILSKNENATAQVAKWSFKVIDGNTETKDVLDFPITRTDNNTSVADGKIAPGTSGEMQIIIDTTGTQVSLIYNVLINLIDCPENMVFYKVKDPSQITSENGEDTRERIYLSKFGGKLEINRYLPVEKASRNIYRNNFLGMAIRNRANSEAN